MLSIPPNGPLCHRLRRRQRSNPTRKSGRRYPPSGHLACGCHQAPTAHLDDPPFKSTAIICRKAEHHANKLLLSRWMQIASSVVRITKVASCNKTILWGRGLRCDTEHEGPNGWRCCSAPCFCRRCRFRRQSPKTSKGMRPSNQLLRQKSIRQPLIRATQSPARQRQSAASGSETLLAHRSCEVGGQLHQEHLQACSRVVIHCLPCC